MSPKPEDESEDGKPISYVPPDAKVNLENSEMEPPEVIYEDRRAEFRKEQIEKAIGGKRTIHEKND